jgi:hypothetical protein
MAQTAIPAPSFACGDIRYWIDAYEDKAAEDRFRLKALEKLVLICDGYEAVKSDRVLLTVVSDALDRRSEITLVQSLFDKYRCLSGARAEAGYTAVAARLQTAHCPTAADLERWHVVSVRRANVRRGPAMSAAFAGGLARGTVVVETGRDGDWMKIETWKGLSGYVHRSLVTEFRAYSGK